MFKRVLVPLDGSMLAELALEPALHLAQQTDGSVYLMRVPIYTDSGAQTSPEYHRVWTSENDLPEYEDAAVYLREMRETISRPGVTVRTMIVEGDRANAIVDSAVTSEIDLITMATHARTGVSRWLLGSIAGKVVRQSKSPIMIVRQPSDYEHIMVTLDGSELAERIVEPALNLAIAFRSRITFFLVDDAIEPDLNQGAAVTAENKKSGASDNSYLNGIISRYEHTGLEIDAVSETGPVADRILAYANQNNVDLIAMSTQGRSGLRKLIFGSVTEKVMSSSGCAMLIIRPGDDE